MIIQDIKNIQSGQKDLKNFGLLVGGVFFILGLVSLWRHRTVWELFVPLGVVLMLLGMIAPRTLKAAYKIWMSLAIVLGFVVTTIILTIFFLVGMTLVTLISKIVGKKFLDISYKTSATSYWKKKEPLKKKAADWEKQY
jgi:hypothetical protein